ncbi:beta strand repeat-containing protein, partial [Clavibacter sp. VKM Ac-2872]|uniref:beta strand repeat-containing protein n=1 Tax=Clavibacter sp. VKM Ac-2872 TaxID=2783812 RepID=UPI00351B7C06
MLAIALITSSLTLGSGLFGPAPAAQAAAGNPGVPSAPTTLYTEDFENAATATAIPLTSYTGATGTTYNSDGLYGDQGECNGLVLNPNSAFAGNQCVNGPNSVNNKATLKNMVGALGALNGTGAANDAVSAMTASQNVPPNTVEFRTTKQIALPAANGRFITLGVSVAAACGDGGADFNQPRLAFNFVDSAGRETSATNNPVNPCGGATQGILAKALVSDKGILFSGSSVGINMRNVDGGGNRGNDHAFDDIKILDVTPQLDKSFSPASARTGGNSTLTFTITNTSELGQKNGWSFTDALSSGLTISNPSAATTTCASGVVTAPAGGTSVAVTGNLNAGQTSCTVSVNVTSNTAGTYTNGPQNVTTTGLNPPGTSTVTFSNPSVGVIKRAGTPVDVNGNGVTDAGDTIQYTFDVTNTGDVPLSNVSVTDAKAGTVTCPSGTLAPQATVTCSAAAPYTITTADQNAGAVNNTATASGTPPNSTTPVTSTPSTTSTPVTTPVQSLTLDKTATPSDAASFTVGRQITYSFLVTNTGNVALNDVSIDETSFTGSGTLSNATCPATTLAAGASTTCTATYTVTQADVDAGGVTNTAVANGTPQGSTTPIPSNPDTVVLPGLSTPSITLQKTASPTTISAAGDVVTYSFAATNNGNVTLTNVTIDETQFSGTGTAPVITCPSGAASLAPGASVTCTATYTATQADVDAGQITNTATATGTPPRGPAVTSDPSQAVVTADPNPSVAVVKSANPSSIMNAGETVDYSFVVTNTGNVTLTNASVSETQFSGTGTAPVVSCPDAAASLAPGASVTCTASYVATQADVDAGSITNTATATGTPPSGDPVTSDPSSAVVTAGAAPGLTMVKSANPTAVSKVGDTITYSFLFTNTGNTTLTNITVNETAFSGTGTPSAVAYPTRTLAPGESTTATATYVVTQADVDAGKVDNSATGAGTPPGDTPVVVTPPSDVTVPIDPAPGLTMVKSANPTTVSKVGDTITYSFLFTNTGNTTLTNITVNETE